MNAVCVANVIEISSNVTWNVLGCAPKIAPSPSPTRKNGTFQRSVPNW